MAPFHGRHLGPRAGLGVQLSCLLWKEAQPDDTGPGSLSSVHLELCTCDHLGYARGRAGQVGSSPEPAGREL